LPDRRRFNQRERAALFIAADGLCTECGNELPPRWHADHVEPHSAGGPTDVANGQALCPICNLRKGSTLQYNDVFVPRPFQRNVEDAVMDGLASGRRITTVEASPGSGKTLAYQSTITALWRAGLIDHAAVFVPRLILARQCETSWMTRVIDPATGGEQWTGKHTLFDARRRFGMLQHIPNRPPLTPPGIVGVGFVQTYSALVTMPAIYESWAKTHRGRFLLIADEAQFCGAGDEKAGTMAGAWIEEISQYAAHTLLLTGTPYRADNKPLVLADYTEPDEIGIRRLVSHATAGYADGVGEGYLRRFEAQMTDVRSRRRYLDNVAIEYDISRDGTDLREVLREPRVWHPLVDAVVESLREKQKVNPQYRALISCMEQREARNVEKYLNHRNPKLRVKIAVSDDGPEAEMALREFQTPAGADVLVTVRKAFIGYDCPQITVVGVLTNYRDQGHLMQLVGRGLRTWSDVAPRDQSCRVIAPDDPKMSEFIDFMRGQSEQGLRQMRERDAGADRHPVEKQEALYVIEDAYATTTRGASNDVELGSRDWELIEAIKRESGSVDDTTTLARVIELAGIKLSEKPQWRAELAEVADFGNAVEEASLVAHGGPALTEQERIKTINGKVAKVIRSNLAARGITPDNPSYGDLLAKETKRVNDRAGFRSENVRTVDSALSRLRAARAIRESVEA
jgi:superfamily II DNA or RNA helicase